MGGPLGLIDLGDDRIGLDRIMGFNFEKGTYVPEQGIRSRDDFQDTIESYL